MNKVLNSRYIENNNLTKDNIVKTILSMLELFWDENFWYEEWVYQIISKNLIILLEKIKEIEINSEEIVNIEEINSIIINLWKSIKDKDNELDFSQINLLLEEIMSWFLNKEKIQDFEIKNDYIVFLDEVLDYYWENYEKWKKSIKKVQDLVKTILD